MLDLILTVGAYFILIVWLSERDNTTKRGGYNE